MPIRHQKTQTVQSRVTESIKLKVARYQAKHHCSEGQVVRLALEKFLHNVVAKSIQGEKKS